MMSDYQATVLDRFADLLQKRLVERGSRPVFWSVGQQKILAEGEFTEENTITESIVTKMPIIKFGKNAKQI